ncbi:ATP-binding protein [Cocleimonas sp. KMM 6892]|uniref:ATP-binding protein n=1 Tax=unclassified Cocleimonas TaxID=2639732 RepID=UPI002DBD13B8|nr:MULTISPECIES: ATP-binding protein [unclassified Cocleimonas]MEB8431086.1 ATP-binding protein [Cocleimonas sp. KMM 6892]MEC4714142.1 ATP-binding protein [Cocleimonas sp. KMM 6895]MEC4743473.1 ATP-binding protein [Cocleimonas sp. KMM 6896]
MTFKLWHKLVLTIVCITGIVLILAIFLSNQSVKSGFLAYLNDVEERRSDSFSVVLLRQYHKHGNWDFIKGNRRLWERSFYQSRDINVRKEEAQPVLDVNIIGKRAKESEGPAERPEGRRPPPGKFPPPPRKKHLEAIGNPPPLFIEDNEFRSEQPRSVSRGATKPPPKSMALLDANKSFLVGGTQASENATLKPLKFSGKVVGYIRSEPFNEITDELDQQFVQHQNQAFIKISLWALAIVLIGAGLFAAYLRSRINKIGDQAGLLTSGDYRCQSIDKSQDELGQLSKKLNILGETLEENRSSRRRWISDISHELRTPVTVLKGEIEAIQDKVRELTPSSIDSLHQEVLRLSRLISDLNELSLSDLGALSYHKETLNIVELVEDIITQHQHQFDEKNISVTFNSSNENIEIDGDGQRLEQLFANLANNSQHYTCTSGQLEINIKKQADSVIIEWSDSEPGVSDEELGRLFERLYRVEASRNRNAGGSGLGLSIAQNIVAAHDGNIEAKHSPLGGISFVITFPINRH